MKVVRLLFRRRYLLALFAIALMRSTAPSVAHGQTCCIANTAIMDDEGEVEATVEMAANQSEVDGYVEVDNFSYELYDDIEYVGAEGDLYDGSSLVSSPPDDYEYDAAFAFPAASTHVGDVYTLDGWAGACYYYDEEGDCEFANLGYLPLQLQTGAPSISRINPNSGTIGDQGKTITVTGENLVDDFGASGVSITGGVTAQVDQNSSSTQATIDYSIPSSATAGQQTLTMANSFGNSNGEQFTVGYPPAVVTNVSPATWTAGQNNIAVTITGQNFGTAPTLSISAPGVTVSGYTANPNGQSIQATVNVAVNAPNEAVQITVQPGYTGKNFYCGSCNGGSPNGTDTANVQQSLPAPTIAIQNSGTNTPFAGQQVTLQVSAPNGFIISPGSQTWTFGNASDAVANYIITYNGTTPTNACYVPVVPGSGTGICTGSVFSLTNPTLGPFYFIVPGATETVTVAASYQMADGSTSAPVSSAPQSFNIQGPTVNLQAAMPTDGTGVQIYAYSGNEFLGIWGVPGDDLNPITGIYFKGNATNVPSNVQSLLTWVQIISTQQSKDIESSGVVPSPVKIGLDSSFPYDLADNTSDRPADELLSDAGEDWRTFTATMYTMWDPSLPSGCTPAYSTSVLNPDGSYTLKSYPSQCTQSIPIPLSSVTYHWSGCAINTLVNQREPDGSDSTWLESTLSGCPKQTLGTPGTTSQFPTWTTLGNY
jgi:hypothetical protein